MNRLQIGPTSVSILIVGFYLAGCTGVPEPRTIPEVEAIAEVETTPEGETIPEVDTVPEVETIDPGSAYPPPGSLGNTTEGTGSAHSITSLSVPFPVFNGPEPSLPGVSTYTPSQGGVELPRALPFVSPEKPASMDTVPVITPPGPTEPPRATKPSDRSEGAKAESEGPERQEPIPGAPAPQEAQPVESVTTPQSPSLSIAPTTHRTDTRSGETVIVELPGPGWLYMGNSERAELLAREVPPDMSVTRFSFRVFGSTKLVFEAQELETGRRTRHEEQVTVVSEEDQPVPAPSIDNTETRQGVSGALEEPANDTQMVDTPSNDKQKFDPHRYGEIIAAIDSGTSEGVLQSWSTVEEYLKKLEDAGEERAVGEIMEHLWAQQRWQSDELLFRLAQFYDADRPTRNVRRARDLYRQLTERYIFSPYTEAAKQRFRYLDRHFFNIR